MDEKTFIEKNPNKIGEELYRSIFRKSALLTIALLENYPQVICFFYDTFFIGNRMTAY